MIIKLNYKKNSHYKNSNLILFSDEKTNLKNLKKNLSNLEFNYISELLKVNDLKKNVFKFDINSKKSIFIVSVKKNLKPYEIENLGAEFFVKINQEKKKRILHYI